MAAKNAQNGSQQRTHLWPDSSVAARQTFEQHQLWPSQIKKLVARAERSNEPSTTAHTDDYRRHTPPRSHQQKSLEQKSLAGFLFLILEKYSEVSVLFICVKQ
jgi:hypothetical protein